MALDNWTNDLTRLAQEARDNPSRSHDTLMCVAINPGDEQIIEKAAATTTLMIPSNLLEQPSASVEDQSWLLSMVNLFDDVEKFMFVLPPTEQAAAIAGELSRRLGPDRCYVTPWPTGYNTLAEYYEAKGEPGLSELREAMTASTRWPASGIVTIDQLMDDVTRMYLHGEPKGFSTGWPFIDEYYTLKTGQITLITGVPSHGKSQWLTALAMNMAKIHGWGTTIFSPENAPLKLYVKQLIEMHRHEPFYDTYHMPRMPVRGPMESMAWLRQYFTFILPEEDESPTIDYILDKAKSEVKTRGIKGLIIDPWNEVLHSYGHKATETEYVSEALSRVKDFARRYDVHVWIVAHPTKLQKAPLGSIYEGQYPPASLYDINGSSHFNNKADCGITLWRERDAHGNFTNRTELHVLKIRFRDVGSPGMAELMYNVHQSKYTQYFEDVH